MRKKKERKKERKGGKVRESSKSRERDNLIEQWWSKCWPMENCWQLNRKRERESLHITAVYYYNHSVHSSAHCRPSVDSCGLKERERESEVRIRILRSPLPPNGTAAAVQSAVNNRAHRELFDRSQSTHRHNGAKV